MVLKIFEERVMMNQANKKILNISFVKNDLGRYSLVFFVFCLLGFVAFLFRSVDLVPHVDSDFFFSSQDTQLQADIKISKAFPEGSPSLLILSAMGKIQSPLYVDKIHSLSNTLLKLPELTAVKSITHGPSDIDDAFASPLWKRLLLSEDGRSTNLIILMNNESLQESISKIEKILADFDQTDFQLKISGVPYIVEQIRKNLWHDLKTFSLFAGLLFGVILFLVFRSFIILLGTLVSCLLSCMLTLIIAQAFQLKMGILTANLMTIVFILTLSPILFLTFNWKNIDEYLEKSSTHPILQTIRITFKGSFWSMLTTFLGFLSLLNVQAKPLRELGVLGSIGTLVAFLCAYLIYPVFLSLLEPSFNQNTQGHDSKNVSRFLKGKYGKVVAFLICASIFISLGFKKLNTDPSLLTYFAPQSALRESLEYIDKNGGSSPLKLVVKDAQNQKLNTKQAYQKMWNLQNELEKNPYVGVVISLPVVMAEGKRAGMAFLLTWEGLLKKMGEHVQLVKNFITDDRQFAYFLLRMKESHLNVSRTEVMKQIETIVQNCGFDLEMKGGVYLLQGKLAQLVVSSLIYGLAGLFLVFAFISLIISFSIRTSLAIIFSLLMIPGVILGLNGFLNVPLDIICAPASNVALGMGIDAMLYTTIAARRFRKHGLSSWDAWIKARSSQCKAILSSALIVSFGFGIFAFSSFPPTQRFGLSIVVGTFVSCAASLFVLPFLAAEPITNFKRWKVFSKKEKSF